MNKAAMAKQAPTDPAYWQIQLNDAVCIYLQALQAATGKKPAGADAYDNLEAAESTLVYAWRRFNKHAAQNSTPADTPVH